MAPDKLKRFRAKRMPEVNRDTPYDQIALDHNARQETRHNSIAKTWIDKEITGSCTF